jgi:hypothetical protein
MLSFKEAASQAPAAAVASTAATGAATGSELPPLKLRLIFGTGAIHRALAANEAGNHNRPATTLDATNAKKIKVRLLNIAEKMLVKKGKK